MPAIYLGIFALAALGGALYPPNNFDALTYRLPQVLHWLDAGRWHWIATSNEHLNITGAGFSWLMAPLLALTQSDRALFLPNIIAFAFLPGLFFSVARGCGIRRQVAWYWMWIVPSGYCFALQAGGLANDLLPATYILAAVALALRSKRSGSIHDAWFSIMAAALATGVKIVVLPLGLPWLFAIAPARHLLARHPLGSAVVISSALAVSFLPTAVLNAKYAGSWSGDPANTTHLRVTNPFYGIVGNGLQIVNTNLAPPLWPFSQDTNVQLVRFEESATGQAIRAHYSRFELRWFELAAEDGAGIGLGIIVLTVASMLGGFGRNLRPAGNSDSLALQVGMAGLIALIAYSAVMGSEAAPRLITAYYPFLVLLLLCLLGLDTLVRRFWWRVLAGCCAASIIPVLILTPARPLWPAQNVLAKLTGEHPDQPFLQRVQLVYDVFSHRHDYLDPLKRFIPPGAHTVGFVPTGNDLEGSLWRPFGTRRVVEVLAPNRSDAAVQQLSGSVIICSPRGLMDRFGMTVDEFSAAIGGRLAGKEVLTIKAAVGPESWCAIAVE